ncbi:MAG: TauD/TfdA family dioxygenase [Ilumatobacter sp.]|uniref:TauD/TfdA family dioxygenase n=1 Tax=Ilumatobacter sp. TaxID=1967498 RepID=UPI003C777E11
MSGKSVATPDFYTYEWDPIAGAEVDGRFVDLRWSDGAELRAVDFWLRENAVGAGGVDLATREGLFDPAELCDDIAIAALEVGPDGELRITWAPDGVEAVYHPGWLRHVADGQHLATSWIPRPVPWTAATMPELPTHDGSKVLDDDAVFAGWLNDMLRHGVSRLRGCPTDADFNSALAGRIGAVRDTNFGAHWDVKADVAMAGDASTNSTANTNRRLGPHTDLPTRETPPGFQFLRCIANEAGGGFSTMADGAAVVDALCAEHPEHYEALTTLRWVFFNRGPGIDHRWSGPLIDLGVDGSPLTLRAFYPVRGFPDMAAEDMPRAYAAMSCFSRLADSDRFKLASPFLPGDLVGFDNRRILHGRDAFESGGHRHLRGMYIDHDEVRSAARVVNRRLGQTHSTPNS